MNYIELPSKCVDYLVNATINDPKTPQKDKRIMLKLVCVNVRNKKKSHQNNKITLN